MIYRAENICFCGGKQFQDLNAENLNAVRERLKKLVCIGAPCVIKSDMPMG